MDRKARSTNPDPPGGTKGLGKKIYFNPLDYFYILEAVLEMTLAQNNGELNQISVFKTRSKVTTVINLIIDIIQSII